MMLGTVYLVVADRCRIEGPLILGIHVSRELATEWAKYALEHNQNIETAEVVEVPFNEFKLEGHHV